MPLTRTPDHVLLPISIVGDATCNAAIATVICIGQDTLTEPIPLQDGFGFTIFILLNCFTVLGKKAQAGEEEKNLSSSKVYLCKKRTQ